MLYTIQYNTKWNASVFSNHNIKIYIRSFQCTNRTCVTNTVTQCCMSAYQKGRSSYCRR